MDSAKKVLELSGIKEPNPVQKLALDNGLLGKDNIVLAAPTASGKTLVAEIAALETIKHNKKVIYIVPLRALASEKYQEFREKYEPSGIKIAISIGDMDSSNPWLARYDLIIVTSEKLDSLLRHGLPWLESVGLVVADEIHLLDSPDRGPTLEVVLTRLRQVCNPRILGLSATISNYKELAEWLDAKPLKSDFRPVKLYQGVFYNNKLHFHPKKILKLESEEPLPDLVEDTLKKGKQVLTFISTRRNAEAAAEKLAKSIKRFLTPKERSELAKISESILKALGHPTRQCYRLAGMVREGAAFHHAGLTNKQRGLVEQAFKSGLIKVITATPTLAAGINLPAFRVIIRDLKRFSYSGMDWIPVLEIQQMMGRAGRPQFDKEGQAVLIAKNKGEAQHIWKNYIMGEAENITSKLGVEPVLRSHVLALIATGTTPTKESLFEFFSKTFYAYQYEDFESLKAKIERVIDMLQDFRFITTDQARSEGPFQTGDAFLAKDSSLKPTRIGKRVAELYIDPITANSFIQDLDRASKKRPSELGYLHSISNTLEMFPPLQVYKSDMESLNEMILKGETDLLKPPPDPYDLEYDDYLRSLKTARLFIAWIEETGEDAILENFRVTPGELRTRLNNADWLLYSLQELGLLLNHKDILRDIRKTRLRVQYGIREELMPLVKLKGIGRVRARQLFASNFKTLDSLRKIPQESLARILGPKLAQDIKKQL